MKNLPQSVSLSACYHAVRFYESDRSLARIVADFLGEGLAAGSPAIVVATPAQRGAIVRELAARSLDIARLQSAHDLILLDAEETLSAIMADGNPDEQSFTTVMCEVIEKAGRGRARCAVRIYGQMVDVLWRNGLHEAAIRLEVLWNRLSQTHALSLLCGYAMGHFYKDASVERICSHHTHVVSADGEAAAVA